MTKMQNPIEKLLEIYGNPGTIATLLGIDRQVVDGWISRGRIPFRRGEQIEEKTNGQVTKQSVWEYANKSLNNR